MRVINLYGGPGSGKSTTAAAVFAVLKGRGYNAELAREWCKGPVWDGYHAALADQVYLFGKQYRELARFARGGVEVVVSDSPLLLSVTYGAAEGEYFAAYVRQVNARFENFDVFLTRAKPYNSAGRCQDEAGARALDAEMFSLTGGRWDLSVPGLLGAGAQIVDRWQMASIAARSRTPAGG